MNYQEENPLNQRPNSTDEISEDPELRNLLAEWRAPEPTGSFDQHVFSDYRRQFHQKSWWRRWLTGSIRLPVPVAAMVGVLLCATSYLAVRKATSYSIEVVPAITPVKIVEIPVPVIQEKVVTRVVYAKPRLQKNERDFAPDFLNTIDESKAIAQADLSGFRPVSEIKIIVSKGGQEK